MEQQKLRSLKTQSGQPNESGAAKSNGQASAKIEAILATSRLPTINP